jgi:DNA-binding protein HU-beta
LTLLYVITILITGDYQTLYWEEIITMNKTELVNSMADKSGLSKKDAEKALNAFLNVVEDAMVDGDKIALVGFGTFEVRTRAARKGRNPQTKEEITIPESKTPAFKAGKAFKDAVNK